MSLDRLREGQLQAHSALHQQAELLRDLVVLQKETVRVQRQTAQMLVNISKAKDSTPRATSPESSKLTATAATQWAAAAVMLIYVIKGGDPAILLKALFGG